MNGSLLFQVLDKPDDAGRGVITIRTTKLERHVARLRSAGLTIPDPVGVDRFDTLRFAQFADPEGNTVGLLGEATFRGRQRYGAAGNCPRALHIEVTPSIVQVMAL